MTHSNKASLKQRAIDAACSVAEEQRLSFDDAVVLRDLSNVVLHLRGTAVVARVATVTGEIRKGDAWFAREVAVASHLAEAGAPVVPPSRLIDPGPHHHGGLVLSFWELIHEREEPTDPRTAGRNLRECHAALADFEGSLPRWGSWYETVRVRSGTLRGKGR